MIVPIEQIPEDQLTGLISEYILTAEGNDVDETPFEDKILSVRSALKRGELVVSFSELHESVGIRRADEYQGAS